MQKQKKVGSTNYHTINEFGGIDRSSPFCKNSSAKVMENFRIALDGSLIKRGGYQYRASLPEVPRQLWSGELWGEQKIFAVIGSSVYSFEADNGICYQIGSLTNNNKEVSFIFYDKELYIFDGECLFRYDSTEVFGEVKGYAPLYGDGWDPIDMGAVKEPFNMLSEYVTIRYKIGETPSKLNIGFTATGVESAYFSSGRIPESEELTLSLDGKHIVCNFPESNCNLTICLLRDGFTQSYRNVCCSLGAVVSTDSKGSRIHTYAGGSKPIVCSSRRVSDSQIKFSKIHVPGSDGIYFPQDECIFIDGGAKINAVCAIYDMLFIFTESSTYAKNTDSNDNSIKLVNTTVGCSTKHGLYAIGDKLYTVCKSGIYKWDTAMGTKGRIDACIISQPVADLTDEYFVENTKVFYCGKKNELWFTMANKKLLVYNTMRNAFYEFLNINNSLMFYYLDDVALTINKRIYVLSDLEVYDLDENLNEVDISARYVSNYIDFSDAQIKKRIAGVSLLCSTEEEDLYLDFNADLGNAVSLIIVGQSRDYPQIEKRRLPIGRFTLLNFCIRSTKPAKQKIYSLTLSADTEKQ